MRTLMESFRLNHETLGQAEYHRRPELGSSTLKTLDRDGAELCALSQAGAIEHDSRALVMGSAIHAYFESPDSWLANYAECPDSRGFSSSDTNAFQALEAEHAASGRILLTRAEYRTARECGEALERKFGPFLIGRRKWIEPSLFWNEPEGDGSFVSCKCRPDVLVDMGDGSALYLEIKTTGDNSPRGWKSSCWRYGYWIQQAHYQAGILAATGCGMVRTIFVVVRKPAPFTVRLYEFDPLTAACAESKWRDLIREYSRRMREHDWSDETGLNPTQIDLGMAIQDDLEDMT